MTDFWSGWVILLSVFTLAASLFLFIYGLWVDIPTQPDGTSGHVWAHGVLREGVRSLPVWWIVISAIGFVAAFGYLALYPGFGAFKGVLGWTAHDELARDQAAHRQLEAPLRERVARQDGRIHRHRPGGIARGRNAVRRELRGMPRPRTREAMSRWAPRISPTVTGSMAVTASRSWRASWTGAAARCRHSRARCLEEEINDLVHYVSSLSGRPSDSLERATWQATVLQLRPLPRRRRARATRRSARRTSPTPCGSTAATAPTSPRRSVKAAMA